MSHFFDTVPADSTFTCPELDAIAAAGGVVTSIGYGYACRCSAPEEQHGYSFRWVNTQGMGNHGRLVLVGTTPRTRAILRESRIAQLQRDLDTDYHSALALDHAAGGVQRGRETAVLQAARILARLPPCVLESFPGVGGGAARWRESIAGALGGSEWGVVAAISCPRLDAAVEIAQRAQAGAR